MNWFGWLYNFLPTLFAVVSSIVMSTLDKSIRQKHVIISVILILIAAFLSVIIVYAASPHITVLYDNSDTYIKLSKRNDWVFARIGIQNDGFLDAHCQLFLTNVATKDGDWKENISDESLILGISNRETSQQFQEQLISPGVHVLFDVASLVPKNTDNMNIPTAPRGEITQFREIEPTPLKKGLYRITVRGNGNNCGFGPSVIYILFDESGILTYTDSVGSPIGSNDVANIPSTAATRHVAGRH